ncbi:fungal-specific transcription factor domain-containing protein [Mycena pura]|uniref:Fungal-specific transcription factor domain-containing protein n=1 Tax=Mycena pura TaxID=153505 RepID=A0AAD6VPI4_9AGAR|nr:fungal-specific transcription factor domain-containing protein [Mycena pura]
MLPSSPTRVRKLERACDSCRRRKTKCDGSKMQDSVCSNCRSAHKPCTYLEASAPRGPPKAYVTSLEDRLAQLEDLLQQVRPDTDFSAEIGPPIPRGSWKEEGGSPPVASTSRHQHRESSSRPSLCFLTHLALNTHEADSDSDGFSSSDSEHMYEGFAGGFQRLTLTGDKEINNRYHGKSSVVSLIDMTRRYKELYMSDTVGGEVEHRSTCLPRPAEENSPPFKRPEYWLAHPWEIQWECPEIEDDSLLASVFEEFPPPSLASELIDLYFVHSNSQLPVLHRPTFERQFRDKLYHRYTWFSCVCLGIFAVASRWSNDPLVLPRKCKRTASGDLDWTCAGWHYYSIAMGILRIRQSLLYPARLEEIQMFSLLAAFLRGTASANHAAAWVFINIGMRKAQDVGAHRKRVYGDAPNAEGELWKRAFWCLVAYDRYGSALLGRPCASEEEDFDLDPCLEVDDQFWETTPTFRQPREVPCRLSYFTLWVRLSQIVTFIVKTIYSVHNPRALLGRIAKVRTDEVMAQLTRALREWLHSVPEYLRWSPHIDDVELSNQSASLQVTYHLVEMLMYRAFIPPVQSPSSPAAQSPHIHSTFPALSYCIRAARSCARIIEVQLPRGWTNTPLLITVSQLSATVLTLGVWDAKVKDPESEDIKPPAIASLMDDIAILIGALRSVESRWETVPNLIRGLKDALPKEPFKEGTGVISTSHLAEPRGMYTFDDHGPLLSSARTSSVHPHYTQFDHPSI